ncbi:UsfY protein [Mycobacterium paraintracellulare]|nr:UsfY protein [Mycobacterium paraintracellulare]
MPGPGYVVEVGDRADDPVDHVRTTRKHAGQNWKNTAAMPGLIAVGLGAAALCVTLFAVAAGHAAAGAAAAAITLLLFGSGLGWLGRESRRVRRIEARYLQEHPEADAQPPAS